MRFLVDLNLSPRLAARLNELGHDAVHASDLGLDARPDREVMDRARREERVIISADTDFGMILASTHATSPSFVLVRRMQGRRVDDLVELIASSLPQIEEALGEGSVVVLGGIVRIRRLPIL